MTIYVTADPHFGHVKVSELRGFDSTEEHDKAVLRSYYDKLGSRDDLWILGDLTAGGRAQEERALGLLHQLRQAQGTRLHLVTGNHDSCSPIHRDSWSRQARFMEVFTSVQSMARRRGPGKIPVFMSHFPYAEAGDGPHREGARYPEYRLPDLGHWLLHGHTHQPEQISGPRSLHVGWDAWRRPVAWNEIEAFIATSEEMA